MLKLNTSAIAVALVLSLAGPAAAQDPNEVVATVGDTEITMGQLVLARTQLPGQYDQFPDEVLFEGILDQLIQQQLLADSLTEITDRARAATANAQREILAGVAIDALTQVAVTEDAVQALYQEMFGGAEPTPEFNASHLLVETEEEAVAAKERVDGGEDFADVARDVSTGPTGPQGGNLGWFGAGRMVAEFEQAVQELEAGEVSGPVQTQFGWHIIKLNDIRMQDQPELEMVRRQIEAQVRENVVEERLQVLASGTEIVRPEPGDFDPSLINRVDILDNARQ